MSLCLMRVLGTGEGAGQLELCRLGLADPVNWWQKGESCQGA